MACKVWTHIHSLVSRTLSLQEVTFKKLKDISDNEELSQKNTQQISKVLTTEAQAAKVGRDMLLSRLSKAEGDILALSTKFITGLKSTSSNSNDTGDITNLRIDSIRNQIDTELLPKVNELFARFSSQEIFNTMFKAQPKDQDAILSNVNYKTVESISELIRAGIDTATSEANACKKLVDSLTGEITKLRETQEFLKMELTKDINDKYKPIEVKMTAYVENHDAQLKAVNDRINSFASEVIDSKKYNSDISKNDLRPFTNNITKNTDKIGELELDRKSVV